MLLDTFKLHTMTVQVSYANCYELWDKAGAIARRLAAVWPGADLDKGTPNEQILRTPTASIQTAFLASTVTLQKPKLDGGTLAQLAQTFDVWRSELALEKLTRVSCRSRYVKDFSTPKAANEFVIGMGLAPWPEGRIFDQPVGGKGNSLEIAFRFEDEASFAVVRVGAEHLLVEMKSHPDIENEPVKKEKHRAFIDFDRGLLAEIDARALRLDEWLKGYQHLLRRDLEKVLRAKVES
jgi:hypothetical protein